MRIHLDFIVERMKSYDPDYLVELLNISAEDIIERFRDLIEERQDLLREELEVFSEDEFEPEVDALDLDDLESSYEDY